MNIEVENVFNSYPIEYREPLLKIRELIYTIASKIPEIGKLDESLKWGQPTYSTLETKSGSPIRIDRFEEDKIAIFFHCQTSLVESFRTLFRDTLEFSKNRAIVIDPNKEMKMNELAICIELALTYRLKRPTIEYKNI
ncbi:MAG: DUF1801 domain-containing protein [Coprobacillaceae bacterium]